MAWTEERKREHSKLLKARHAKDRAIREALKAKEAEKVNIQDRMQQTSDELLEKFEQPMRVGPSSTPSNPLPEGMPLDALADKAASYRDDELQVISRTSGLLHSQGQVLESVVTISRPPEADPTPEGLVPWEPETESYEPVSNVQPFVVSENGIGTREQMTFSAEGRLTGGAPTPTIPEMIEHLEGCDSTEDVIMQAADWLVILKKLVALSGDE